MRSQVTILLVDDHAIVREGLAACLAAETRVAICGQAGNACEARSLIERHRPSLTVLDLAMPGVDGLGLLHELRARHPHGKLVVLSMHPAAIWETRALAAGADVSVARNLSQGRMVSSISTPTMASCDLMARTMSAVSSEASARTLKPAG